MDALSNLMVVVISEYIFMCIYIHTNTHVYVCVHACVYVSYIYTYMCMYVSTHHILHFKLIMLYVNYDSKCWKKYIMLLCHHYKQEPGKKQE